MIDILQNKFVLLGGAAVLFFISYRLFFSRDKAGETLDREYEEVISSDKYKVKGQYD